MKRFSATHGFTLIELVVVVAILGVLLAIAIPGYSDQVRKTRRATAKTEIMGIVQTKERFNSLNNTYVGSPCGASSEFYTISCPTSTATTFTVLATAINGQTSDTACLNLGINEQGVRTETGSGTVTDCW